MVVRIPYSQLDQADLFVDAIYESNRDAAPGALSAEPLNKLMKVGNLGGFRTRSGKDGILFAVLTSTGVEPEWPDSLDPLTGVYTYFGDNRKPGREMHSTKQRGNHLLRTAFEHSASNDRAVRANCPIFFIFEWAGQARDHVFRGLAVPGSEFLAPGEDLIAIWRSAGGERFQNYRASLTVLDEAQISGSWIRDSIANGQLLLDDARAPKSLVSWVKDGKYLPLRSEPIGVRTVEDQQPHGKSQLAVLKAILDYCGDDPFEFERVAAEVWKLNCPAPVEYQLTKHYRDGGRDAVGQIALGPSADPIRMMFALEAKLYGQKNTVGVRELSRLISRLKHREFGVLVTTSSVSKQAYEELRNDAHPVVVLSGKDICDVLAGIGIANYRECSEWLRRL